MPIPILSFVVIFGTSLGRVSNTILRAISLILLAGGLYQANRYICCSGEQGAVGVPFLVMFGMAIFLLMYSLLFAIHIVPKSNKLPKLLHRTLNKRDAQSR